MPKVRRRYKYPYPDLMAGDIVCCDTRGPFPWLIRIVTGGVSTHTGILIPIGDQLFVGEMERRGVRLNSLETKYQKRTKRVISFRRVPGLRDMDRVIIVNEFAELFRRSAEYDFKGLLEFVCERVKDSKRRLYCSEMVYVLTRAFVQYAPSFDIKVSPEELLTTTVLDTIWHR